MADQVVYAISPAQFEAKRDALNKKLSKDIGKTSGVIEEHGVTANWSYDQVNLKIDIVKKPFYLSSDFVHSQIEAFFKS